MIDHTVMTMSGAVIIAVQVLGSARDAVFDAGKVVGYEDRHVSWKWRHAFIFGERWPVQVVGLVLLYFGLRDEILMPVVLLSALVVMSLHQAVYDTVYWNRKLFAGDDSKPGWYLWLSNLWSWIPWA